MNFSYWEYKSWFSNIDFTIVGSGIVGLNCALYLKMRHPNANILVLEQGLLPSGASTKNAGFACFGSLSEILGDLESHTEEEVLELVKKRLEGLRLLRKNLGEKEIGYKEWGGYELFDVGDQDLYEKCFSQKERINQLLHPIFGEDVFTVAKNDFNFRNVQPEYLFNKFEGQLDTGQMMSQLLKLVQEKGVRILNNVSVEEYSEVGQAVSVGTNLLEFKTKKLFLATNGFAGELGIPDVKPARGQVLITKPIKDLPIKGAFHLYEGYFYFRNIDNRILLGGGRNLDLKTEETTTFGETEFIQEKLESLLRDTILPETVYEIESRWSGIMGVGDQKRAIVKQISENTYCGVRLGGMGVAIGSVVGKDLAELLID